MAKNHLDRQDLVVIGGGTSGMMCALGAIQAKLRVTLICNNTDFLSSSLLSEAIPSKAFSYCSNIAHQIRSAKDFGLEAQLSTINLAKVNRYIKSIVQELQPHNDLDSFEKQGGTLLIGNAKFINNHTVLVNNIQITSKYFIIATGIRPAVANILDLQKQDFLTYRKLFSLTQLPKKTTILGKNPESLEIAQALAKFGSKVTIIFPHKNILPTEDPSFTKKLLAILEQSGIQIYFSTKVLQFCWQNKRKLLICQDRYGDKFAVDSEEIIDMQHYQPNVEALSLPNANVQHTFNGILVNSKLQTTQKNIFAIGSVTDAPYKSIHLMEHQANVILSNIAFNVPREVNYNLTPRVIYTDPQFASIGITQLPKHLAPAAQSLKFKFKDLDAAIYQHQTNGEIKILSANKKILGVTILGPAAHELINEYSLALQIGADISDIANSMHAYPSLSQINKRASHLIFKPSSKNTKLILGRAMYRISQLLDKLSAIT